MNELHKQVREDAGELLNEMVDAVFQHASAAAKNTGLRAEQLLKLALGGRTESIFKKAVAILVDGMEKDLLDQYHQKKPELKAVGGKE